MIKIYTVKGGKRNLLSPEQLIRESANQGMDEIIKITTDLLNQAIDCKAITPQKLELIFSQGGKFPYLFFKE